MRLRNIRIAKYYPRSGSYDFRYKSVAVGAIDVVKVDFGGYLEKDSVVFRDRFGVPIKLNPRTNTLTFTAPQTADTNYIYAYDKTGERIGKLMVKTYAEKVYDVVLVSVNGAKLPDTDMLKKYLNETYNQVAVSWNIGIDTISIPELRHFSHGGSSWTGVYNDDQKLVLSSYDQKIRKDTYYLFFIDNANSSGVAGYMPLYHQCGFIYNFPNNRTIAHELGHGVFGLVHTFGSGVKGTSDNLMDYNFGDRLWHPQWDLIHNPKFKLLKWNQDEKDGEFLDVFMFLLPILKGEGVSHMDYSVGGGVGLVLGEKIGIGMGVALDYKKNICLYFSYDGLANGLLPRLTNSKNFYQGDIYDIASIEMGASVGFSRSVTYDWNYKDLTELLGENYAVNVGIGPLNLGLEFVEDSKVLGFTLGAGLSFGDVFFECAKSNSIGVIMKYNEFFDLFPMQENQSALYNVGFGIYDKYGRKKLFFNCLKFRIDTNLSVVRRKNILITPSALKDYPLLNQE